jgi:hypothetical protein
VSRSRSSTKKSLFVAEVFGLTPCPLSAAREAPTRTEFGGEGVEEL